MENAVYNTAETNEVRTMTESDYYAIPDDIKAELIEGQIYYMASPRTVHQILLLELASRINNYIKKNGGSCKVIIDIDTKLNTAKDTIVRPDISVICEPEKITEKRCEGSPDWIIEITSPSDPKHDYLTKLSLYQHVGVREYWIVDPDKRSVIVYRLTDDKFDTTCYTFCDTIPVGIYDDFIIDFNAINEAIETDRT